MLMPALSRAREEARRIACASNMRQIAESLMIYLNNFNGWMPPQIEEVDDFGDPTAVQPNPGLDGISNVMDPAQANGRVFYCPSVEGYTLPSHPVTALSDTSYMPNGAVFARPVASVTQASQIIYLQEENFHANTVWQSPFALSTSDWPGLQASFYVFHAKAGEVYWRWHEFDYLGHGVENFCNNHSEGGNLAFVDGHVEYRKYKSLRSGDFGLTPDEPWSSTNSDPYGGQQADTPPYSYTSAF